MINEISNVRLSKQALEAVELLFHKHFLRGDKLWLFGSRTDITKKGGDIDFYVETQAKTIADAIKMKSDFIWELEQIIGEQKIDLVLNMLNFPHPIPIHDIARTKGINII